MAGTGIVTMPWAFQQSGIILGVILTFIAFIISFYTCYLVIKTAGNDIDYTETLKRYFGKYGWSFGMTCFIVNLYVPILLFF
jgi:amino acid permease